MIGSWFHFLWGNSIYLFILILAQDMGWTLFLPDCQRRVCCHHRKLRVGCRQDKAADWLQCQVTLVFQQHCDPCILFWIIAFLVPLSSVSGLSADDSLEWSSFFRIWADSKVLGDNRWIKRHHSNVWQDLEGKWKVHSRAEKARRCEILKKKELNNIEIGCINVHDRHSHTMWVEEALEVFKWKSSLTLQAFLREAFPLHSHLEGPSTDFSLTSLSRFPTSNPSEIYLRIIKPWPKTTSEFSPQSGKRRWAATVIFSSHSPTKMSANLEPQFWEQPQKQLYHSPNSHHPQGRWGTHKTPPELHNISALLTWEEGRQGWGGKREEDKEWDEYAACLVDSS